MGLPLAATFAALMLDNSLSIAGISMVFLVAVVTASVILPRGAAICATLVCVTALNFFFIPPRRSLHVAQTEYWWILTVLVALALALGEMVARLEQRRTQAEQERMQAFQVHAFSEELSQCSGHQAMAARAATWLAQATGHPCAVYLREKPDQLSRLFSDPVVHPGFDDRAARWVIDNGRPAGQGCMDWSELPLWCAPFARHNAAGAVQLLLPASDTPAAETLEHWRNLVLQAGLSIERERAAVAARRAEDHAQAEAARNTLLASLSHDLRTPLAGIVGSASALRIQGEALSPEQRARLLENLEDEALDMALMADNVLQLARLSQPGVAPRRQWESLADMLGAAVQRMRRRWPQAQIELRCPEDLPPLLAEASLLAQAIANLVDNAIRHGGAPPRVSVEAGRGEQIVWVSVRDHGPGLPPGDPDALFSRWQRGTGAAKEGTGLGLAICRLAVQAHGGTIAARNAQPGAEFRIDLPAAPMPPVPA